MRYRNRLTRCPHCLDKLSADKDAVTSDNRFIYRTRFCNGCGAVVHTKQAPEELCGGGDTAELPHLRAESLQDGARYGL